MLRISATVLTLSIVTATGCPSFDRQAQPNQAPVADAGEDLQVVAGADVVLEGHGTDPEDDAFVLRWEQVAGVPVTPDTDLSTGVASFQAPLASTVLVFSLVAVDSFDAVSEPDLVRVAVDYNRAPVADTGGYVETPNGAPIHLIGRASDPDGDTISAWQWEVLSAPAGVDLSTVLTDADTRNPIFQPAVKGEYLLALTVTDARGTASAPDSLVAVALNNPPVGVIAASPDPTDPGLLELDGTGSTDPDGDPIASYLWRVKTAPGSGQVTFSPDANAPVVDVSIVGRGVFFLELLVADDEGAMGAPVETVIQVNHPPTAGVVSPIVTVEELTPIAMDASPTVDVDGDPLTYTWTLTSGSSLFPTPLSGVRPTAPAPSFAALELADVDSVATYELVVSDGEFSTAPIAVTVQVTPSDANFVFLSDGPAANDDPGCGTRVRPCRSFQTALAATFDGGGTRDGRHMVATSGSHTVTLDASSVLWPPGMYFLGGRDPISFQRAAGTGIVVRNNSGVAGNCGPAPTFLFFQASSGAQTLITGMEVRYIDSCGWTTYSPVLHCNACDLVLRDGSSIFVGQDGPLNAGPPLRITSGGNVVARRMAFEISINASNNNLGIDLGSGTLELLDSTVWIDSKSGINGEDAALRVGGGSDATIDGSVLTISGPLTSANSTAERRAALLVANGQVTARNSVIYGTLGRLVHVVVLRTGTLSVWNSVVRGIGEATGVGAAIYAEQAVTVANSIVEGQPRAIQLAAGGALSSFLHGNALATTDGVFLRCLNSDWTSIDDANAADGVGCNASGTDWSGNLDAICPQVDPANGDYHLNTAAGPNACVDAGVTSSPDGVAPATDIDGDPRPDPTSGLPDIGPDET